MLIRPLRSEEKDLHNSVVDHPLQTWEWGEFRKHTGIEVERIGFFDSNKIQKAIQVTFHKIPKLNWKIGYFPKGYMPDAEQLAALRQIAKQHNAIFVKLEPNVCQPVTSPSAHNTVGQFLLDNGCKPGRPLFYKYTFNIDLTKSEEKLFTNLDSKTRYNVRLAHKKGVQIIEQSNKEGLEMYVKILEETTKRQGFYAHSPKFFREMWKSLKDSGIMHIFQAVYQGQVLASWIMFVFNKTLYYPYGSSRSIHREVMASNLMLWEMIRFGQKMGLKIFDLWGSLGPDADKKHSWYGFHRFKKGYGGELMEFLGSYDLVINYPLYQLFTVGDNLRWKWLKLKAKLHL